MASDGVRRSGRVRTAVVSYADEQAAEQQVVATTKRAAKRKRASAANDDHLKQDEPAKPKKKSKKAAKEDAEPAPTGKAKAKGKAPAKKKAANASSSKPKKTTFDHESAAQKRIASNNRQVNKKKVRAGEEETRLRDYVDEPPASYRGALKRATTQRMFVLDRERGVEADCHANHDDCPNETIELAGSTGNVYTVTISHLPSCTCPVGIFTKKGSEQLCKHILYILHFVLKASDELKQQNAFLTSELKEMFEDAPPLPAVVAMDDSAMDGKRKPVEDDCPICCMEFEGDEDVVWCRAACGNNIHKACFDQWAKVKQGNVTCPFCRTEWEADKPKTQKLKVAEVKMPAERGEGGYRNVRDQLEYDD